MATIKLYPSVISTVNGTWTNPDNAKGDDGVYAVVAGSRNTNIDIIGSDFTNSIPAGSTINSVVAEVEYKLSTTASAWTGTLQAQKAGTLSGTAITTTTEPTTDTVWTNSTTGTWSYADLANAQVLLRIRQTSNTACNYSVDYLAITVDYTIPVYDFSSSVLISNGDQVNLTGNKHNSSVVTLSEGLQESLLSNKNIVTALLDSLGDVVTVSSNKQSFISLLDSLGDVMFASGIMVQTSFDYSSSVVLSHGDVVVISGVKAVSSNTTISDGINLSFVVKKNMSASTYFSDGIQDSISSFKGVDQSILFSIGDNIFLNVSKLVLDRLMKVSALQDLYLKGEIVEGSKVSLSNLGVLTVIEIVEGDTFNLSPTGVLTVNTFIEGVI